MYINLYCAFHKHANSKVQKPPSQLRFSLPSIIITITSNEPWNTETHKTDRNPPITNHKQWPFEPVKVKSCFLRGPLRCLTFAKNTIVSWLLNFRFRMFVKSAVIDQPYTHQRFRNLCPLWSRKTWSSILFQTLRWVYKRLGRKKHIQNSQQFSYLTRFRNLKFPPWSPSMMGFGRSRVRFSPGARKFSFPGLAWFLHLPMQVKMFTGSVSVQFSSAHLKNK